MAFQNSYLISTLSDYILPTTTNTIKFEMFTLSILKLI